MRMYNDIEWNDIKIEVEVFKPGFANSKMTNNYNFNTTEVQADSHLYGMTTKRERLKNFKGYEFAERLPDDNSQIVLYTVINGKFMSIIGDFMLKQRLVCNQCIAIEVSDDDKWIEYR